MAAPMKFTHVAGFAWRSWCSLRFRRSLHSSFTTCNSSTGDRVNDPPNTDDTASTNTSQVDATVQGKRSVGSDGRTPSAHDGSQGECDTNLAAGADAGLLKAFRMFDKLKQSDDKNAMPAPPIESFATMLRKSKLVQIGDPNGRIIVGEIFDVVEDDLYVDFGGKFHAVCKRPRVRGEDYHRGVQVKLRLHDLELASHFMGAPRSITLLEADATLIGLYRPARTTSATGKKWPS